MPGHGISDGHPGKYDSSRLLEAVNVEVCALDRYLPECTSLARGGVTLRCTLDIYFQMTDL